MESKKIIEQLEQRLAHLEQGPPNWLECELEQIYNRLGKLEAALGPAPELTDNPEEQGPDFWVNPARLKNKEVHNGG